MPLAEVALCLSEVLGDKLLPVTVNVRQDDTPEI